MPDALKLEAGKFYRTRTGEKTGPIVYDPAWYKDEFPFVVIDQPRFEHDRANFAWREDGTWSLSGSPAPRDLTVEWSDEPPPRNPDATERLATAAERIAASLELIVAAQHLAPLVVAAEQPSVDFARPLRIGDRVKDITDPTASGMIYAIRHDKEVQIHWDGNPEPGESWRPIEDFTRLPD